MEGGSPALIRERWTLPMYYAQQRYWSDNPRLEALFIMANFKKWKPRYTPPPAADPAAPARPIDWSMLNATS